MERVGVMVWIRLWRLRCFKVLLKRYFHTLKLLILFFYTHCSFAYCKQM